MKFEWEFFHRGNFGEVFPGAIAVDLPSSMSGQERHFDHHSDCGGDPRSSSEIIFGRRAEMDSLKSKDKVVICCHVEPDMDCAVASYVAVKHLLGQIPSEGRGKWRALCKVVTQVDQGRVSPINMGMPENDFNVYTLFLLLHDYVSSEYEKTGNWGSIATDINGLGTVFNKEERDHRFMAYAIFLLESLMKLDEQTFKAAIAFESPAQGSSAGDSLRLPGLRTVLPLDVPDQGLHPIFPALAKFVETRIAEARGEIQRRLESGDCSVFLATVPVPNASGVRANSRKVWACFIRLPFKYVPVMKALRGGPVAGMKGLPEGENLELLAIQPEEQPSRVIFSISPEKHDQFSLKGLGLALDDANVRKRQPLVNASRYWRMVNGSPEPDPLFPYPHPWYDGRGHQYTIVDAPDGTENQRLTGQQILEILKGEWYLNASRYETSEYKEWSDGEEVKS